MVRADPYGKKPVKEIDQDPGCSDCMKRCDSSKNFVDHISSFQCFATKKKIKSEDIFSTLHKIWQTKCWIN